jgi:Na+/proline symporter
MDSEELDVSVTRAPKRLRMIGLARTVLWWGIGLAVVGALLIVFVPAIADSLNIGATEEGQTVRIGIELAIRVARELLPPLGAAFIAAALVMGFIQARDGE